MQKIYQALTFRASSIGDCLMGKYLLENIHNQFPEARLGIVVGRRGGMIRDLFAAYPWLTVIEANRRNPASVFRLLKEWRGSDFVVTQYAGRPGGRFSFPSKLAARALAKKGGVVGFSDTSPINRFLYGRIVPRMTKTAPAECERQALKAGGIPVVYEKLKMKFIEITDLEKKFGIDREFIVVHMFSGSKGWGFNPDKKREILLAAVKNFLDFQILASGGVADREEARDAGENLPLINIAGKTSLQELMNLIARSRGVVSLDSGVAHLAAQLGKPFVVFASCLGLHWWQEEQYSSGRIRVLSRPDKCVSGHVYKDFPICLNDVDGQSINFK